MSKRWSSEHAGLQTQCEHACSPCGRVTLTENIRAPRPQPSAKVLHRGFLFPEGEIFPTIDDPEFTRKPLIS